MKSVVSERGQITIPKELRDRLGLRPGSIIDFSEENGKLIATKIIDADPLEAAFGILKLGKTTDQIMLELRGEVDTIDP